MGARSSTHGAQKPPEPIRNIAPELHPSRLRSSGSSRTFVELEHNSKVFPWPHTRNERPAMAGPDPQPRPQRLRTFRLKTEAETWAREQEGRLDKGETPIGRPPGTPRNARRPDRPPLRRSPRTRPRHRPQQGSDPAPHQGQHRRHPHLPHHPRLPRPVRQAPSQGRRRPRHHRHRHLLHRHRHGARRRRPRHRRPRPSNSASPVSPSTASVSSPSPPSETVGRANSELDQIITTADSNPRQIIPLGRSSSSPLRRRCARTKSAGSCWRTSTPRNQR